MYKNIIELSKILSKLKCKVANEIYSNYLKDIYSLKPCKEEYDITTANNYILLLEEKIKLLKYNFKMTNETPLRLDKTSLDFFFEKENELTKCDRKILENII